MLAAAPVHTTLPTGDVDALRRFYEDVLGFQPLATRPGLALYEAAGGTRFALSRATGRATGGHTQMAFLVVDLAAMVRDLRRRGVVFEAYDAPPTTDGIAALPSGRAAWFKDPDGNLIGLLELSEPL